MRSLRVVAVLIAMIAFWAHPACAAMYKWVDDNGVVHFSDAPPASVRKVETIEPPNYPPPPPKAAKPPAAPGRRTAKPSKATVSPKKKVNHQVEIYTTRWCGYCKKAIAFLNANGIPFKAYDIEKDRKAAAKMKALGGSGGVPFAIINGKKVAGFSARTYKRVLGLM